MQARDFVAQTGVDALAIAIVAPATAPTCASERGAILLHKDPEFKPLPIAQEFLPPKPTKKIK